MTRKELEEIMERNDFYQSEIESAIYFVVDMLETLADKLEMDEPYAVNTIQNMRDSTREVRNLEDIIWEAMENDEED